MEQIVAQQDGVVECAVIGADDAIKGMVPIAFVVVRSGAEQDETLQARVIAAVRGELGAVAALKTAHIVAQLPKTRSGKILRNLLRKIASGQPFDVPATIDDPAIPGAIAAQVQRAAS
jgi:propionyl-CoA synthetase